MRALLGGVTAVLMFGFVASADDKKDEKIDAKLLVGKWSPKEKKEGTTFVVEFTKDGKATFTSVTDGKEMKGDGTYTLDGNKLALTMKFGEKERKTTRTVTKLTDTELVSSEGGGKDDTLVRIKDK